MQILMYLLHNIHDNCELYSSKVLDLAQPIFTFAFFITSFYKQAAFSLVFEEKQLCSRFPFSVQLGILPIAKFQSG